MRKKEVRMSKKAIKNEMKYVLKSLRIKRKIQFGVKSGKTDNKFT